jgi:hypothetical protein
MPSQQLLKEMQRNLLHIRDAGGVAQRVRVHTQQRKLLEAEFAVEHRDGKMFVAGTELVADDAVPFGEYEIEAP